MTGKIIKAISLGAAALGAAATLLSGWASEKIMEETIEQKVGEALAEKKEEEKP